MTKQIKTVGDDFYNFVFNTCKNIAEELEIAQAQRDSKSMTGVGFLMAVDAINKRHQLEIAQAQQEAVERFANFVNDRMLIRDRVIAKHGDTKHQGSMSILNILDLYKRSEALQTKGQNDRSKSIS